MCEKLHRRAYAQDRTRGPWNCQATMLHTVPPCCPLVSILLSLIVPVILSFESSTGEECQECLLPVLLHPTVLHLASKASAKCRYRGETQGLGCHPGQGQRSSKMKYISVEKLALRLSCQRSLVELELWSEQEHQWCSLTHGKLEQTNWIEPKLFFQEIGFFKRHFCQQLLEHVYAL